MILGTHELRISKDHFVYTNVHTYYGYLGDRSSWRSSTPLSTLMGYHLARNSTEEDSGLIVVVVVVVVVYWWWWRWG